MEQSGSSDRPRHDQLVPKARRKDAPALSGTVVRAGERQLADQGCRSRADFIAVHYSRPPYSIRTPKPAHGHDYC